MQRNKRDDDRFDSVTTRPVLITGGSGFIGANLAERLLEGGENVVLLDNLSRAGVAENARSLSERFGSRVRLVIADVRDEKAVANWVERASAVYHFAAQVAVTTSLVDPVLDFDVNVCGTLNVLEALRRLSAPPPLLFTSTNKVYGALSDIALRETELRYTPRDAALAASGVDEDRPLSFCSPYGCSKGAADQYVLDYAHSYGLKAAVLRMSCIYGPRQFGNEDQGWVAHFLIKAARGEPITIYGDGKQVRDILFVSDLMDAMLIARSRIDELAGTAFNIGGGPGNVISLRELLRQVEELTGRAVEVRFAQVRVGDQPYYVSNTSLFRRATGWQPRVDAARGVRLLYDWLLLHRIERGVGTEHTPARGPLASTCASGASS
jgi:CDP-paratose 2-epimerase